MVIFCWIDLFRKEKLYLQCCGDCVCVFISVCLAINLHIIPLCDSQLWERPRLFMVSWSVSAGGPSVFSFDRRLIITFFFTPLEEAYSLFWTFFSFFSFKLFYDLFLFLFLHYTTIGLHQQHIHPNVLLRQHYGKAALTTRDHKEALCAAAGFTHTAFREDQTTQHSSRTNIYPSLSVLCPCCCPGSHRKEPLYIPKRLCVCLLCPSMSARSPCLVKSPLRPLLREHCLLTLS